MSDPGADVVWYVDPATVSFEPSATERAILDEVNRRIAGRASLEEVIDYLFAATRTISPCDRIGLAFVDDEGWIVSHYVAADYDEPVLRKGYREDLERGSLKVVLQRGQPRIINDLEQYLAANPESIATRLLVQEGVRSSLTCPLVVEGRNVGVMFRSSRRAGAYDDAQVGLHLAIVERLSQAVEKVRRIEQLDAANRAYTELLGFVSHELKSPVAAMISNMRLLEEGYLGELTDKQLDLVRRSIGGGEYLLGLVGEYLDLAQLESGKLHRNAAADVDFVAQVIEPAVAVIQTPLEEKGITLTRELPSSPRAVEVDSAAMKIVLVNFLSNAVKYGDQDGEIRLRMTQAADSLAVSVWNTGPGFGPEQRGRLFRKFSRLKSPKLMREKGTGVGLYTVRRLVQLHGGRVWANSEPEQWAEFGFEIPQPLGESEEG